MKKYNLQAVVIKNVKYKDADKIFTLFSKEMGKISAVARGVRKITSKRAGNLDTLNLVSIAIRTNSNSFNDIEEVKTLESFSDLKKDLSKSVKSYYIVEMIHKATEEGEQSVPLFDLLVKSLKMMQKTPNPSFVVCFFELNLMTILGYKMTLDKCGKCGKKLDGTWVKYRFNIENGSLECEDCSKFGVALSQEAALGMHFLYHGKTTKELGTCIDEIDKLTKIYTGRKLESKFKSLEMD